MFVEIGDARFLGVVGSIMSVILVIVVVESLVGVLEHPEGVISGRSQTNVDRTSTVSIAQSGQSRFYVMGIIKNVSEHISPRITVSGHFH